MLIADKNDKTATFKVAFLTVMSIFVMGYLNGLALNTHNLGAMISAQSGNIIWLGLNAAGGYWGAFIENLGLFFGFMGGAVFALYTQKIFKNKSLQFFYNWTIFVVPIIIYPLLLQKTVPPYVSFFILGFASGAALGFFRNVYHLEINNAMATGSVRFLGLHTAHVLKEKSKKEYSNFLIFFVCVFAFAAGAFLYGILARIDHSLVETGLGKIGLGSDGARYNRLSFGLYGYQGEFRMAVASREVATNISRIIGLIVICVVPYFFCPKAKV